MNYETGRWIFGRLDIRETTLNVGFEAQNRHPLILRLS